MAWYVKDSDGEYLGGVNATRHGIDIWWWEDREDCLPFDDRNSAETALAACYSQGFLGLRIVKDKGE